MGKISNNVLITSISKKISLINAVKNAANKIDINIKVFGGDISVDCLGKYFVDFFWQMPPLANLEIDTLIEYCRKNAITAIIPTRDGELIYFATNKQQLKIAGISVMVSDIEQIKTCLDKLTFSQFGSQNLLPFIPSAVKIDDIKAEKYIVKERYGAGSKFIGLNLNKFSAIEHSKKLEDPIYQPYIVGNEYSIDSYTDNAGTVKGVVIRSRDLVVDGESQITTTFVDEQLESVFKEIITKLNLYGHAVTQAFINQELNIQVIECNSRFGGASAVAIKAGLDSFYWFLSESNGVDISNYSFVRNSVPIKQVRYQTDMYI